MTKTISQDLRKRVVDYIETGHSCRAAARHFQVSESFAIKLFARWKAERSIEPRPRARPLGSGKLAPYREFLRAQVETQPDITLWELTECLKQQHGIDVHFSNVSRCLKAMGLTYKKTLVATERYRADVVRKRTAWIHRQKLMRLEPGRLVFIDETSTNTKMTRMYGRAPKGETRVRGLYLMRRWALEYPNIHRRVTQ